MKKVNFIDYMGSGGGLIRESLSNGMYTFKSSPGIFYWAIPIKIMYHMYLKSIL
jgi:hypothetical protein